MKNEKTKYTFFDNQPTVEFCLPKKPSKLVMAFIITLFTVLTACIVVAGVTFYEIFKDHVIIIGDEYFNTQVLDEDGLKPTVITPYTGEIPQINVFDEPETQELETSEIAKNMLPSTTGVTSYDISLGVPIKMGSGSGVVISLDGFIVTNAHVIHESSYVEVSFYDGTIYEAEVVGMDIHTDLAVLKIDGKDLEFAQLGNAEQVEVGDRAIAIGNPKSYENTVTQGIVSSKKREILIDVTSVNKEVLSVIQTDASINPGNSGGALLNGYGQVIGINSAKLMQNGYEGIAFAIPINIVKPVVDELIKNGEIIHKAKLGVMVVDVNDILEEFRDEYPEYGLVVVEMDLNCPLLDIGFNLGDVITHVEGVPLKTSDPLLEEISKRKPGDELEITIQQAQKEKPETVTIKLVAKIE